MKTKARGFQKLAPRAKTMLQGARTQGRPMPAPMPPQAAAPMMQPKPIAAGPRLLGGAIPGR